MKKTLVWILMMCFLITLSGCNEVYQDGRIDRESSSLSVASSQAQVESLADIINNDAISVEYKLKDKWIHEDIDTAVAKDFINRLTDTFPEKFGEIASAYMPEDIIIKINFEESAQHSVNVNSSTTTVKEVSISTIEINHNGTVFLMPQGTALAKIENIGAVIASDQPTE